MAMLNNQRVGLPHCENREGCHTIMAPAWLSNANIISIFAWKHWLNRLVSCCCLFLASLKFDGGWRNVCTTVSYVFFFLQDTRWTKNHAWERCHCFPVFCFSSGGLKKTVWSIVVEPSPFVGTIPAGDKVLRMSGRHVPATLRPCWDGHFRNGFEAKEWWVPAY